MASTVGTSVLGAFQASLSVLITLSYGVIAARLGMVDAGTAKNVSSLCVNMFLPALLITNVGRQIDIHNFTNYIPIFIWSFAYHAISMIISKLVVKGFKLPSWVVPACTFNNTTSLPLLLTKSLMSTGILSVIAGENVSDAVDRAQSYFLINSMCSNAATFAIGPKLLGSDIMEDDEDGEGESDSQRQQNGSDDDEPDELTSLLPKPVTDRVSAAGQASSNYFHDLPEGVQSTLSFISSLFNPTLWGALLAVAIGLTPPVHRAFFNKTQEGGWLNAWFTSSLENIGDLFTSLQMFVVGSKLSDSLTTKPDEPSPRPPKTALAVIFVIRFIFWGLISIPLIYLLATKTRLLSDDPMLWWSMMLVSSL